MISLNTLDAIIDDILLEARNNNISESENLSRTQIEQWVHQYRAFLIKQDIDKGRGINQDYIQEMRNLELDTFDQNGDFDSDGNNIRYRFITKKTIPNVLDFNDIFGMTSVTDSNGNEIQITSMQRANMQAYKKYTNNLISSPNKTCVAYQYLNNVVILGPVSIGSINIKGVFENPVDQRFLDIDLDNAEDNLFKYKYPMPINMIPLLKELILTKELKITAPTDQSNDSKQNLQQNVSQQK